MEKVSFYRSYSLLSFPERWILIFKIFLGGNGTVVRVPTGKASGPGFKPCQFQMILLFLNGASQGLEREIEPVVT